MAAETGVGGCVQLHPLLDGRWSEAGPSANAIVEFDSQKSRLVEVKEIAIQVSN
jgi:hypothetical protein